MQNDVWSLPYVVEIDGVEHPIRNRCDYRVVLDVICALNDPDITDDEKIKTALFIFYEDVSAISDYETAAAEMFRIINYGNDSANENRPALMDWEHDFKAIAAPVSRVLGFDVRTPEKFVHFWTFLGAYTEIGECTFSTIVSIRSKKAKGQKLEKWEIEFCREHQDAVSLPQKITAEERDLLNSAW